MSRFVYFLIVGLVALGTLWAAVLWVTAPPAAPEGNAQASHGVSLAVGEVDGEPRSDVDYAALDARIQRLMADPAMVGLAVAVVENGRIRFIKGYGETLEGSNEPVTTATVFRWASLSKGVAADMVALLAHDGSLALSDPVSRWASSLRLPNGNEARATVADVLSHQTGLFGHAQDGKLEDGRDPRLLRMSLAGLRNICAPGTCHAYQNVAFDAASEMVERATGRPYAEVVAERLFAPLGMRGASMSRAALMAAPSWARPHNGGASPRSFDIAEPYYRIPAAGGVNGSIEDLALWMIAQTGAAPEVLPPDVLRAVQSARVMTPRETRRRRNFAERTTRTAYGLGWRVLDYGGRRVVGHHGGVAGYRSMIMFDPATRSGVVALWNASTSLPNGLEYEVMDRIYGLPFHDWLGLDTPREGAPAVANEVAEAEQGEVRSARRARSR